MSKVSHACRYRPIYIFQALLHHPEGCVVSTFQLVHLPAETFPDARVWVVLMPFPALKHGLANTEDAGPVAFKIAKKGPVEEFLRVFAGDRGVAEIEFKLPVDVG